MGKAREVVKDLLTQCFKPKACTSAATWVEQNVRLSPKTSHLAGKYSLRHTPYLRRLYEDLDNPRVRKVVIKKAAQLGLTQYANNALLYYIANHTLPALMIMPSKEAAQHFCERSLSPSIELCTALKPFLTGNKDDIKKTEFLFTTSIVRVIGAGSPSKLASNPAALVIVDESDKQEDFGSQGEAPALELAEDRAISFPNDKKIIVLSTPTTENSSVVHSQYLLGSQSKYFVACPHCHHEQVLRFEQIKWPNCKNEDGGYDVDRAEREAWYECESCKAQLREADKISMVRNGRWKDTNPKPFPAEIRSYQISALYSFNVTWGGMAKLFLLSKDDVGKLRNFYNSYLGECFEQRAATIKTESIDALIKASPDYFKGELLAKPDVILMGADTQGDCFWYCVEAVYSTHSAIVDWGQAMTFDDLALVMQRQYKIKDSEEYQGIYKALIDSAGNRTTQVYDFCLKSGLKFIPVVGRQENQGLFAPIRESSVPYKGYNIPLLLINDKLFKDTLYLSVIKQQAQKLYFPQDTDDELKKQLSSERLVEKRNGKGSIVMDWICTNRNNHLGDCAKYLEAFKYRLEPQLRLKRESEQKDSTAILETPKRQYELKNHLQRSYTPNWD